MTADASRIPNAALPSGGARLLVDVAVVLAWIAVVTATFRTAGWPLTAYYAVVFVGVLAYSLAIDPWEWDWLQDRWQDRDRSDD